MLDESARTKFIPKDNLPASRHKRKAKEEINCKISTVFVVLLHHIPEEKRRPRKDNGPVPCFQTMGDLVRIVSGEEGCKEWIGKYHPHKIANPVEAGVVESDRRKGVRENVLRGHPGGN
jgi:hypothetical protein